MRRLRRSDRFHDLTAEEQVQDVINNWGNMFPVLVVTEEQKKEDYEYYLTPSLEDQEYFDDYYVPDILAEIEGTEFEKYWYEIIQGLTPLFFNC